MVRLAVDVVEERVDQLAEPGTVHWLREMVLAIRASSRPLPPRRTRPPPRCAVPGMPGSALVIDGLVRGQTTVHRLAARGFRSGPGLRPRLAEHRAGRALPVMPPPGIRSRASSPSIGSPVTLGADLLAGVHGKALRPASSGRWATLGRCWTSSSAATPRARSSRSRCFRARAGGHLRAGGARRPSGRGRVAGGARPVSARALLGERTLAGEQAASAELVETVYEPIPAAGGERPEPPRRRSRADRARIRWGRPGCCSCTPRPVRGDRLRRRGQSSPDSPRTDP